MKNFQNILLVIDTLEIDEDALSKVKTVLKNTSAHLSVMILEHEFSKNLKEFKSAYEKDMREKLSAKLKDLGLSGDAPVIFADKKPYFVHIIQHVIKKDIDLVIKAAQALDKNHSKGFKSLDMSLLRKCPCPVWLCRDSKDDEKPEIITAIDPLSETPEGRDLSIKLLQYGDYLANILEGHNTVIACWECDYEGVLRHSPFMKMAEDQVDKIIYEAELGTKQALETLMKEAGIENTNAVVKRGKAEEIIPDYIDAHNINLAVMGTVARTGIPGFFIGNTAENIMQNIACGMFAAKPNGFSSPVKAY
ncbi:MAG: universal stress protein [Alphaproteobacteria bacterium]